MQNWTVVKETDSYVIYDMGYSSNSKTKQKKFLCVGGPLAGKRATMKQCNGEYAGFNCSHRISKNGNDPLNQHQMIYVHRSMLVEPVEVTETIDAPITIKE